MIFSFGNQQGRVSAPSTVLPIWVADSFKPVRVRLIEGKTELLPGTDIVRKLDIRVEFGSKRFIVGRGELEMMTFNEKYHWVFHPAPTACAYANMDGYFGKCTNRKLRPCARMGVSGDHSAVRKVGKTKNRRLEGKWGNTKRSLRTCKIQFGILLRECSFGK